MLALALSEGTIQAVQGLGPTIIAILAIGATLYTTRKALAGQAQRDVNNALLSYRLRQLNELYAPLSVKLRQNNLLHERLRHGKPNAEQWRLLDHVEEVRAEASDLELAREILSVDKEMADLIETKAGLVEGPLPESFSAFLGHYSVLKLALDGKQTPAVPEFQYYPRELNEDIAKGMDTVRRALQINLPSSS